MQKIAYGCVVLAAAFGGVGPAAAAPAASPPLRFHSTQYDSPGPDTRTPASLNAEWISLVKTGPAAVHLRGWTVRDATNFVHRFGDVTIAGKGGRIWLHTGRGANAAGHVYWGSGNYVWNNTGDTATLRNPTGTVIDTCAWKNQFGRTLVGC